MNFTGPESLTSRVQSECEHVARALATGGTRHGTKAADLTDEERVALAILGGAHWQIDLQAARIQVLESVGISDRPNGQYAVGLRSL